MAGIDVAELPVGPVPLTIEQRGKLGRRLGDLVQVAIELRTQLTGHTNGSGQCPQDRVQVGHQDRGRDPLAADVGEGEGHAPVGERQNVIVVPADSARRLADGRELEAALRGELSREERLLHFECEVQLRPLARQLVLAGS